MSAIAARYVARSASNRDPDWPFWYVAEGDINVTVPLVPLLRGSMPFLPRTLAEVVAFNANAGSSPDPVFGHLPPLDAAARQVQP